MSETVLVTGASSGIGEAVCRLLCREGYAVIGTARNAGRLEPLAAELGESFLPLVLDVDDADAVAGLPASLPPAFRAVDVLVNNAGHDSGGRQPFEGSDANQMCSVIETNVNGVIRMTHAMIDGMLERGGGQVVNIGSTAGLRPFSTMSAYVASKYAVHGFSESLRLEYTGRGIRVSEILPGLVRTGFAERRLGDARRAAEFYDHHDVSLQPQDVAETLLFALRQPKHVEIAQLLVVPVSYPPSLE